MLSLCMCMLQVLLHYFISYASANGISSFLLLKFLNNILPNSPTVCSAWSFSFLDLGTKSGLNFIVAIPHGIWQIMQNTLNLQNIEILETGTKSSSLCKNAVGVDAEKFYTQIVLFCIVRLLVFFYYQ